MKARTVEGSYSTTYTEVDATIEGGFASVPVTIKQCPRCGGWGTCKLPYTRGHYSCQTCEGFGCVPADAPQEAIRLWQQEDAKRHNSRRAR